MVDSIRLVVCDNFFRETVAVLAGDPDLQGVTVSSFSPRCGRPQLAEGELAALTPFPSPDTDVVGGKCLRELASGPWSDQIHLCSPCLAMFTEHARIQALVAERAFIVTPGWLCFWRQRIAAWGFRTRRELTEFLHGSWERVHLLDTGIDPAAMENLTAFAGYAGLPFDRSPVGLDFYRKYLEVIILGRRLELQRRNADEAALQLRQRCADYAMALDLLSRFTHMQDEEELIRQIVETFAAIFEPENISYVSFFRGKPARIYTLQGESQCPGRALTARVAALEGLYTWSGNGEGFFRIDHNHETLGILLINCAAFSDYRERYLDLVLSTLLPICALSIHNARSFQLVVRTEEALKKVNDELTRLATIDGLTLIANRRRFDFTLDKECHRAHRERVPLSVLMMDVDFFKQYNDLYGHQAGDDCLRIVARVISGAVFRPGDLAARYGGEEFAVILPNTGGAGAAELAEKIRRGVEEEAIVHEGSAVGPCITISVGFAAMVPAEPDAGEKIVALADRALYEAKSRGRNLVVGIEAG